MEKINNPGQSGPKINLNQMPDLKCENCSGMFFTESYMFKKVSKVITGTPEDAIVPIRAYRCQDCGEVLKELLPNTRNQGGTNG